MKAQREIAARAAAVEAQAKRERAAAAAAAAQVSAAATARQVQARKQPVNQARDICRGLLGSEIYDECVADIIANRK